VGRSDATSSLGGGGALEVRLGHETFSSAESQNRRAIRLSQQAYRRGAARCLERSWASSSGPWSWRAERGGDAKKRAAPASITRSYCGPAPKQRTFFLATEFRFLIRSPRKGRRARPRPAPPRGQRRLAAAARCCTSARSAVCLELSDGLLQHQAHRASEALSDRDGEMCSRGQRGPRCVEASGALVPLVNVEF
jgi:hypothetical protein